MPKRKDWSCQVCGSNRQACWAYDGALGGWKNTEQSCAENKPAAPDWADDFEPLEAHVISPGQVRRCMRCGDHAEQCRCGDHHYVKDSPVNRFIAGVD